MTKEAYTYLMKTSEEKYAGLKDSVTAAGDTFGGFMNVAKGLSMLATGGLFMKRVYDRINNDVRRKSLIEDIALTDPLLKTVDKAQLMEWYATIYHFAPKVSLDKVAVREVLQGFARFGKVDLQTLKMLAETEKALADPQSKAGVWGNILMG